MAGKSHFWASYADLMTSLFFVMLILFILTVCMLQKQIAETEEQRNASEEQLNKIKEIQEGISKIDTTYFEYKTDYKKHVLKIPVSFPRGSSDIGQVDRETLGELRQAGICVRDFIKEAYQGKQVQYLLIIEGQASKDNYSKNYQLSYERALALYQYWKSVNVNFDSNSCEVIISGSGQNGSYRVQPDNASNEANQRFLIHIIPKPGMIELKKR